MIQAVRTTTTSVLLQGLFDAANDDVWREFDARYRPIILAFAGKLGLGADDAADVAQETLVCFLRDYRAGKYDRHRGRLRSWIIGILKYRIADLRRANAARHEGRGVSALGDVPDDEQLTAIWNHERRRAILLQAISELREGTRLTDTTIRAFELYALHEQPAAEVARALSITTRDVYMAKNRVAERLRDILTRLEDLFDDR